ncbi:hypothetical protein DAPPUDRAFT_309162 [Daphnia pulex]|uniref:Caspase 2 n=1 Tax=Daphnia pulex TaxID=6669 RepID=E9HAH5_DAPPU|nr:hypothetical protein DAPPUDRAFT_309162 [Daphnia pulex]|eukprot:EFX71181.1 hypothetical protein DAPPUDRAFT_309162 [Daphnia pulex]
MDLTDANPVGNQLQTPVQAPRRKTSRAECPVDRDSPVYNMKHRRRGKAYIFNHECFDPSLGLSKRVGSSTDVSNLQIALYGLGFQVFGFNDLGVCDVRKIIQQLANEDHSECDCVMVVLLSHGENGKIYTYDSVYHSDELWFPFTSDKCPSLAGKPKLFFIQACQGSKMDKGTLMQCDSAKERDSVVEEYSIPTLADFMIAYSTVPGYASWRNTENGSWFIQSLCHIFKEYGKYEDLLSMMTMVLLKVATLGKGYAQIPCVTSQLIRRVYFYSKMNV